MTSVRLSTRPAKRDRVSLTMPDAAGAKQTTRLVSASQLTLELLGTHSGGEGCNQVGRPKPVLDGRWLDEERSRRDRRLMSALLTFMRVPTQDHQLQGTVALRTAKSFGHRLCEKILPASSASLENFCRNSPQSFRNVGSCILQYLRKPSTCIMDKHIRPNCPQRS